MIAKYVAIAAVVCVSAGAAAQPPKARTIAGAPIRSTAPRSVVIDNIIGRVQLDALISEIVASDTIAVTQRSGTLLANNGSSRLRNRS